MSVRDERQRECDEECVFHEMGWLKLVSAVRAEVEFKLQKHAVLIA